MLVTNLRDWLVVSHGPDGKPAKMEPDRLAESEAAFWETCRHPRTAMEKHERPFEEFLQRALLHGAAGRGLHLRPRAFG